MDPQYKDCFRRRRTEKNHDGQKEQHLVNNKVRHGQCLPDNILTVSRDSTGNITPGPNLTEITCQIEALGGIKAGTLPRLIQVQVRQKYVLFIIS